MPPEGTISQEGSNTWGDLLESVKVAEFDFSGSQACRALRDDGYGRSNID